MSVEEREVTEVEEVDEDELVGLACTEVTSGGAGAIEDAATARVIGGVVTGEEPETTEEVDEDELVGLTCTEVTRGGAGAIEDAPTAVGVEEDPVEEGFAPLAIYTEPITIKLQNTKVQGREFLDTKAAINSKDSKPESLI